MIRAKNLKISTIEKDIISNVALNINNGDFTMIAGANGVGKSTILQALIKLLEYEGSLTFDDLEVSTLEKKNLTSQIKIIFQSSEDYFFTNSIREEVNFLQPNKIDDDEIKKYLNIIKLNKSLDDNPNEMSGGEKQRLAIAIAIQSRPKVLILDETLAMLDQSTKKEILKYLKKLNDEGLTIIVISHDLPDALFMKKIIWLSKDKVQEFPVSEISKSRAQLSKIFFTTKKMWKDIDDY